MLNGVCMGKIKIAVSNSGPLIHLSQVGSFGILDMIKDVYITQEVFDEICSFNLPGRQDVKGSKTIKIKDLGKDAKNYSKLLSEEYSLGLGEATSISLAKQEKVKLFLTDDLLARIVAKNMGLEVHGTIGIVLRAFRLGNITKKKAKEVIGNLQTGSSLFITTDLVRYVMNEIEKM